MPVTSSFVAIAPERFGTAYSYGNGGGVFQLGQNLYLVCSNPGQPQAVFPSGSPPAILAQARVLKSTDGGATWNEVDTDNGPQVALSSGSSGLYSPIAACYKNSTTVIVGYFVWDYIHGDPSELRFSLFDLTTETWGVETTGGPTSTNVLNLSIAYRSLGDTIVFMYDGFENVGGNKARCFYVLYEAAAFSVQAAVDPAQTGSSQDYVFAGVVSGSSGRSHFFYALPDPNGINPTVFNQNTLTAGDALIGPVQVTDQVSLNESGGQGTWSYGAPVSRVVSGVTQLLAGYIDQTTNFLFLAKATSANSPVFSTQQVTATVSPGLAGIFNAGLSASQGAIGSTFNNTPALIATESNDLISWGVPGVLTLIPPDEPVTANPAGIFGETGLPIDYASGYFSAGIIANANLVPPG